MWLLGCVGRGSVFSYVVKGDERGLIIRVSGFNDKLGVSTTGAILYLL